MITIKIDKDSPRKSDMADYLREVARLIDDDFTSGIDWDISGEEETLVDDMDEPDDFSGATDGDR